MNEGESETMYNPTREIKRVYHTRWPGCQLGGMANDSVISNIPIISLVGNFGDICICRYAWQLALMSLNVHRSQNRIQYN